MVCPPCAHTSTYTAEFSVIYGIHGLRRVGPRKDGGLFSTLAFPYWGLIGVGVLSAWFHATLNYHSQMGKWSDFLLQFIQIRVIYRSICRSQIGAETCFAHTTANRIR